LRGLRALAQQQRIEPPVRKRLVQQVLDNESSLSW
jgi:hypothetical protein